MSFTTLDAIVAILDLLLIFLMYRYDKTHLGRGRRTGPVELTLTALLLASVAVFVYMIVAGIVQLNVSTMPYLFLVLLLELLLLMVTVGQRRSGAERAGPEDDRRSSPGEGRVRIPAPINLNKPPLLGVAGSSSVAANHSALSRL